jgi:hydroxymethylpyrimidine/phosphomethylpyrimidine kinase
VSARPVVLAVAGSDPSGGAGLQLDMQVAAAHGAHGAAVPTLLTVQDSRGVREVMPLEPGFFRRSLDAVIADLRPRAIKVGALGSVEVIRELAAALEESNAPMVLDTIVSSSSGSPFLNGDALEVFRRELVPCATLLTPNLSEARRLINLGEAETRTDRLPRPVDLGETKRLAHACFERFGVATLVKGGHAEGDAVDVLVDGEGEHPFSAPRTPGPSPHGTGCALSTAIACELARGASLHEAVAGAKAFVTRAIAEAFRAGQGAPFLRLGDD